MEGKQIYPTHYKISIDTFLEDNKRNIFVIKSHQYCGPKKTQYCGVFRMWQLSINFLFYFGITPFKCVYCTENGQWYLKTSWFHQVR